MKKFLIVILSLGVFGCDDRDDNGDNGGDGDGNDISVEEYFSHYISNQVAYYFFEHVLIGNEQIDDTDWVAAF